MNTSVSRLRLVLLIAPLCVGIAFAVREGVVSVLWKGVHATVQVWTSDADTANLADWARARHFTELALDWNADDPQLLQTAGAVYWWGSWLNREDVPQSTALLEQSLDYYRQSVRQRPTWPDAWIYLAYVKHYSRRWDDEFQSAYERGWLNGAWRQPVILKTVELGFDAWGKLNAANRRRFLLALERAWTRAPRWVQRTAKVKGGTALLCQSLPKLPSAMAYCGKQGYPFPRVGGGD